MMLAPVETERQEIVRAIFGEDQIKYADSSRFRAYFKHYCSAVCPASSGDAVIQVETPALNSHADVLDCVQIIVRNPRIRYNDFLTEAVLSKDANASQREKEYVARVAVDVAFALDCTRDDYHLQNPTNIGGHRFKWEENVSFLSFVESGFQSGAQLVQTPERQLRTAEMIKHKSSLKAWKLSKRYGIKIRGTNNLLEHLVLDVKTMTLKVFYQVSFLRAHLAKSKDDLLDLNFEESIRRCTLPPRLLLETLLTFHEVLFPVTSVRDSKSHAALETMIQKQGFDAEARWIEFVRKVPDDMTFHYWGDRLTALYEVIKRPPPKNAIVAWFERHTSERNALTIAIIGLFLSALFGLLSFIVGLLQLILAWMAYKYPPESRS